MAVEAFQAATKEQEGTDFASVQRRKKQEAAAEEKAARERARARVQEQMQDRERERGQSTVGLAKDDGDAPDEEGTDGADGSRSSVTPTPTRGLSSSSFSTPPSSLPSSRPSSGRGGGERAPLSATAPLFRVRPRRCEQASNISRAKQNFTIQPKEIGIHPNACTILQFFNRF